MLFYPGMDVPPPFVLCEALRLTESDWPEVSRRLQLRLEVLFTAATIPFRTQNGGHYDARQVLKPGLARARAERGSTGRSRAIRRKPWAPLHGARI